MKYSSTPALFALAQWIVSQPYDPGYDVMIEEIWHILLDRLPRDRFEDDFMPIYNQRAEDPGL